MSNKKFNKRELIHNIESIDSIINSLNNILSCDLSPEENESYTKTKEKFLIYKARLTKELIELE